ncbi:multiple epidermal growth factor-like domains 10, partial [Elysia marginata]
MGRGNENESVARDECPPGRYGPSCSESCSVSCDGLLKECNHIDGTCTHGCSAGYENPKCDKICSTGRYGIRCSEYCSWNCKSNACHHIDGTCTHGCSDGYQGDKCDI